MGYWSYLDLGRNGQWMATYDTVEIKIQIQIQAEIVRGIHYPYSHF